VKKAGAEATGPIVADGLHAGAEFNGRTQRREEDAKAQGNF
jgi:hypothetical protein